MGERLGNKKNRVITRGLLGLISLLIISFMIAWHSESYALDMSKESLQKDLEKRIEKCAEYEKNLVTSPTCATLGGEWTVIPLARSGYMTDDFQAKYLENLRDTLIACNGQLHSKKYTEFSRVTLALSSIGVDPSDIFGYNMLAYLADYDNVIWQGINGSTFALLALDSKDYEIPSVEAGKVQSTRENLVNRILEQQLSNGGWNLTGDESAGADPDVTAMALQALARYQSDEKIAKAIKRGVNRLSWMQKSDGGYICYGVINVESCAQVVIAMTALGIEQDDSRFTKNGHTVLERMLSFYNEDGSFRHIDNGDRDMIATDQGYLAMVAVLRYLKGESFLYDMKDSGESDVIIPDKPSKTTESSGSSTNKSTLKKVKVTKVSLNKKKITLKKGKTYTLKAKVKPASATNKKLKWSSSNKKIATVSQKGKVKGIRPGTAKITVMSKDGTKKKATCKVVVKKAATKKKKTTSSISGSSGSAQRSSSGSSSYNSQYSGTSQSTQTYGYSGSSGSGSNTGTGQASTETSAWSFDGAATYKADSSGTSATTDDSFSAQTEDESYPQYAPDMDEEDIDMDSEETESEEILSSDTGSEGNGRRLPVWMEILLGFGAPGLTAVAFRTPWGKTKGKMISMIAFLGRK